MGVMPLSRFQAKLATASGRTLPAADSLDWVNEAQREFGYAFKFQELMGSSYVDTALGQSEYDVPTDFRAFTDDGIKIISPDTRAYGTLDPESRSYYLRAWDVRTSARGAPEFYHRFANKLVIRPPADATVTRLQFDYWKKIVPMAAPADVSVFTDDWDEAIFRGALYRCHMSYGEHDRMINIFNMFLSFVRSRVASEDLEEFPEGGISAIQSQFDNRFRT